MTRTAEQTLGYLDVIERLAESGLSAPPFEKSSGEYATRGSRPEDKAHDTLLLLRNFSWAVRTFPLFDTRCLSRMKEMQLKLEGIPPSQLPTVFVPAFAWGSYGTTMVSLDPTNIYKIPLGNISIYFDSALIQQNFLAFQSINNRASHQISARPPITPRAVEESVEKVADRFSWIYQIWEAEWQPRPLGDPLIVGEVLDEFFLIEQYDLTKMERYIATEFSTPPKKPQTHGA